MRVNGRQSRFEDCESGAVLVFVAISLLAIMGLLTFVIDGSLLLTYQNQRNNAAELAALAVIKTPMFDGGGTPLGRSAYETAALARAKEVVVNNQYIGSSGGPALQWSAADTEPGIRLGRMVGALFKGEDYNNCVNPVLQISCDAVQVRLPTSNVPGMPAIFSGIWGFKHFSTGAVALVMRNSQQGFIVLK